MQSTKSKIATTLVEHVIIIIEQRTAENQISIDYAGIWAYATAIALVIGDGQLQTWHEIDYVIDAIADRDSDWSLRENTTARDIADRLIAEWRTPEPHKVRPLIHP